ncbi:hypothetical protein Moror_13088 [Moniliophthora roreri MCA 2997]|uniref:Uncharacterized protein n=2 Tax=Moniliophthora roreri TaxID=221103 RepID=V2X3X6_MONRO|nr:hypothetical protein Moror_13088 [Moniliophthora roreri MCA 2997]
MSLRTLNSVNTMDVFIPELLPFPITNHPATREEVDNPYYRIPADIDHLADAMKRIALDVEKLQADAVMHERAALAARQKSLHLQRILNAYVNATLPIFRLPEEILSLVLEHCAVADTSGHVLSQLAAPWVFARTCRRFRSVALSTPSIWTLVRLNTKHISPHSPQTSLNMLRLWLERSNPLPISCLALLGGSETNIDSAKALDLLVSQCRRWVDVDLSFGSQGELCYRLADKDGLMPHLRSLRISVTITQGAYQPGREVSQVFCHSPSLKEATLFISSLIPIRPVMSLPWPQLEELAWSVTSPAECLDIAHSFTNLRYLYLEILIDSDLGNQQLRLPHLQHLKMYGPCFAIIKLMNRLILPNLTDFGMNFKEYIHSVADRILASYVRFQKRSVCSPSHFSVPVTLFSTPNSPTIATDMHSVREISIQVGSINNNTQAFLNLTQTPLFRNLRILHVHLEDLSEPLVTEVINLIEARCRSGSRGTLEEVSMDAIQYADRPSAYLSADSPAVRRLLELRKHGLVIQGRIVDGQWHSSYRDTHWVSGDLTLQERRWVRFGYCDWLKVSS